MQIERLVIQRIRKLKVNNSSSLCIVLNFVMENPGVQLKEIQAMFSQQLLLSIR